MKAILDINRTILNSFVFLLILIVTSGKLSAQLSFELTTDADVNNLSNLNAHASEEIAISVSTLAGLGLAGPSGKGASLTSFHFPAGIAIDGSGNMYVSELGNHVIRKISASGEVTTFAGSGVAGFIDGMGTKASFNQPTRMAVDAEDNLYVIDQLNHSIRKITPDGIVTTLAGSGTRGAVDEVGCRASFNFPKAIAVGPNGDIFVADLFNNKIRKITPEGMVSTFAGSGKHGFVDGKGGTADFGYPNGLVVDQLGNLFVTEWSNQAVRKISPDGVVTTFAGSETAGFRNGKSKEALFNGPSGITMDNAGNLYVSEEINHSIRRITSSGLVTTLAGNGEKGAFNGNGSKASFDTPLDMAFDAKGNLFVVDYENHAVRMITMNPLHSSKRLMGSNSNSDRDLNVSKAEHIQASKTPARQSIKADMGLSTSQSEKGGGTQ